jgi:hypothetical protein
MSRRTRSILVVAWLFSLTAVAALAQSLGTTALAPPVVISGSDIGFRVEGRQGDTPVGTLVVRVDGRWVEPKYALRPTPVGSR